MESRPLLEKQQAEQDARFWECVRRGLLLFFWASLAALTGFAIVLLIQAYDSLPPNTWHQRRVTCRYTGPPPQTLLADVTHRIQEASALGCGGLILTQEEVKNPSLRAVVTEGQRYDVRIILEVPILDEYDGEQLQSLKDAARKWMEDGAAGFRLLGGKRTTVIMMSQILQDEEEIVSETDRLILLPDWLCDDEDLPKNNSHLLHTCLIPTWNPQELTVRTDMRDVAWEVTSEDIDDLELRQFLAVTLPGTIILSLNQSLPPPFWLHSLLFLRSQNPALYVGWWQMTSNGSSYSAVSHLGCSTILVIISHSDQSQNLSLHLPPFSASARVLLSTIRGHNRGQLLQERVSLVPGEAQLLRLTPQ